MSMAQLFLSHATSKPIRVYSPTTKICDQLDVGPRVAVSSTPNAARLKAVMAHPIHCIHPAVEIG